MKNSVEQCLSTYFAFPVITLNGLSFFFFFFYNNVNCRLKTIQTKLNACRNPFPGSENEYSFLVRGNIFMRCGFVVKVHASRRIVVMLLSFCRWRKLTNNKEPYSWFSYSGTRRYVVNTTTKYRSWHYGTLKCFRFVWSEFS